jgi:hypothetical protein
MYNISILRPILHLTNRFYLALNCKDPVKAYESNVITLVRVYTSTVTSCVFTFPYAV